MKKLRITVNGKVYEVQVQVLEDDEQIATGAGYLSPLPPTPAAKPAAAPVVATPRPAAPPPGATPLKGDPNAILAPIAGTVQKVFVQAGGTVDAKAPVVLLDAMKMDTYINAPRDGVIESVDCKVGDAVQVGQRLVTFR